MAQAVRTIGALAVSGAIALAAPATAQVRPGSQQGLGLTGADVPKLLKEVSADPYRAPAEPACETIPREILALDRVLGPYVDGPKAKTGMGETAVNYVRKMIPYRGWVRFVTRADSKDKALQAAATAGVARRGFLRGLEAHLQCAGPPERAVAATIDLTDSIPAAAVVADNAAAAPAPQGDRLVRLMLVAAPAGPSVAGPAPQDAGASADATAEPASTPGR